ncbi:lysophospholipid acyltransferase family protein [Stieleria mannarensis]|uniref:lysophospholipid acyltransferase family protein n=1 Tax=Stieleria mannarensis TaxID=2755585 RepID=UPI001603991A|nr:lysophospholipid acyltransferase family protein [Rhodopirellula sp. JC639]
MNRVLPFLVTGFIRLLRATCRVNAINDSRDRLRADGQPYVYAGLHGHQIAMVILAEEKESAGAMVSRSKDGDLIARTLNKLGVIPIRGSGGARRKGGMTALRAMVNHVCSGKPACLAVDGPKGPRGVVNPGIAMLSQKTGAPVLPMSLVPRRRIVLSRTWDRTQIPLPFCRIDGVFGDPMYPREGESVAEFTRRIQDTLLRMEAEYDPKEAAIAHAAIPQEPAMKQAA